MKNNQSGILVIEIILGLVLLAIIAFAVWRVSSANVALNETVPITDTIAVEIIDSEDYLQAQAEKDVNDSGNDSTSQPTTSSSDQTGDVNQAEQPKHTVKVTRSIADKANCLYDGASEYAQTNMHLTNSEFLEERVYLDSTQFYDAVKFAGLEDEIDKERTVVLTPTNWTWENSLTDEQEAYLYEKSENMREFVGWHIIESCFIYNDNAEDISNIIELNTLSGTVTYDGSGYGAFNGAQVAMWDWFTENGAIIFITDFINKSSLPQ